MSSGPVAVIGVGNPLMRDDGVGLAALERLRREWDLGADVQLVDGGTWGMNLLPVIEDARAVIFIDAIRAGGQPGEAVTLERSELPAWIGPKLSPHQIDLKEVLALAELRGTLPARAVALGVEPAAVELGTSLSPEVSEVLDRLIERVTGRLERWGCRCERRAEPACTS